MDRTNSLAYAALRASSRRLLQFVEAEIARSGSDTITLFADQFAPVGSRRIIVPGLSELHALGLIEWRRYPKRHQIGLSDRYLAIASAEQAMVVSRGCSPSL